MVDNSRDKKRPTIDGYKIVDIRLVERPALPVRQNFNEEELNALAESIREKGILVPLLVRPQGEKFEVIDGDRRLEACWRLKHNEIPIVVRDTDDRETLIQRMLANLDRENPDPVEEALYIARALTATKCEVKEFARLLGRTPKWIADRLVIAEMPDYLQQAIKDKIISLGVAVKLFEIDDPQVLLRYTHAAFRDGMTIRAAEQCVNQYELMKQSFEQTGQEMTSDRAPEPVTVPLAQCAKCGQTDTIDKMRVVRIHIEECSINPS